MSDSAGFVADQFISKTRVTPVYIWWRRGRSVSVPATVRARLSMSMVILVGGESDGGVLAPKAT